MHTRKRLLPHLCLALLCLLIVVLGAAGVLTRPLIAEPAKLVLGLIGLVAAGRAAREPGPAQAAWRTVAFGFTLLAATAPVLLVLRERGFRTGDDVLHVAFLIVLLVSLQLFPRPATHGRERWKAALDALTVLVAATMVLWYTAVGPYVWRHGFSGTVLVTVAGWPLADLALLYSVARLALRGADPAARRPLRLLAAAVLVLFSGDVVHGYLHGRGLPTLHSSWQLGCWLVGDALVAAAALGPDRDRAAARGPRASLPALRYLPFAAIAVAHLLMLVAAVREGSFYPWGGLAAGGAALSAIVLGRQILVQRESDQRAVTDGLTGLANRALVRDASYRALARGERTGRLTAILVLDMNGFKQVNDTLGHRAGDLVLVEFARMLRRSVPSPGLPARLGGDEFAVVLGDLVSPEQAYEVAGRIAAEISPVIVDGHLVAMAASIGVAVSGPGELSHDALVHRADQAMYRAKELAPETRWAAWRESFAADALPAAA